MLTVPSVGARRNSISSTLLVPSRTLAQCAIRRPTTQTMPLCDTTSGVEPRRALRYFRVDQEILQALASHHTQRLKTVPRLSPRTTSGPPTSSRSSCAVWPSGPL